MVEPKGSKSLSGRCYCNACTVTATTFPTTVAYCHCEDCRRVTGAPVAAFAAFPENSVTLAAGARAAASATPGVARWFCPSCGSPLASTFDYLPDQIYVPIGILDDPEALAPMLHCHADQSLSWLCLSDDLPRYGTSALASLSSGEASS